MLNPRSMASSRTAPNSADSAELTDPSENFERIVRVLQRQIGRERSTTTLRLEPENLGKLRLDLDLRQEQLSLRIAPATDLAHRLLRDDLASLKAGLEAAGIQLQRIEILPPPPDGAGRGGPRHDSRRESGGSGDSGAQRGRDFGGESRQTAREHGWLDEASLNLVV